MTEPTFEDKKTHAYLLGLEVKLAEMKGMDAAGPIRVKIEGPGAEVTIRLPCSLMRSLISHHHRSIADVWVRDSAYAREHGYQEAG